jgi:hypothetical protein
MRKVITILCISFFSIICRAQDSTISLSKFEKFSSQTGVMLKNETKYIGKIRDIKVYKVRTTDLETNQSLSAVKIDQRKSALMTIVSTGLLYIDIDELDGVSKSLQFYLKEIKNSKPKYEPFYLYTTSNDVQVHCYYEDVPNFSGWFVGLSKQYHYSKETIPNTRISLKNKDIDDFVELITSAKSAEL